MGILNAQVLLRTLNSISTKYSILLKVTYKRLLDFLRTLETRSSWFLAALNQAIMDEVDIINLSIGSTNFTDYPFVSKVCPAINFVFNILVQRSKKQ